MTPRELAAHLEEEIFGLMFLFKGMDYCSAMSVPRSRRARMLEWGLKIKRKQAGKSDLGDDDVTDALRSMGEAAS